MARSTEMARSTSDRRTKHTLSLLRTYARYSVPTHTTYLHGIFVSKFKFKKRNSPPFQKTRNKKPLYHSADGDERTHRSFYIREISLCGIGIYLHRVGSTCSIWIRILAFLSPRQFFIPIPQLVPPLITYLPIPIYLPDYLHKAPALHSLDRHSAPRNKFSHLFSRINVRYTNSLRIVCTKIGFFFL